MGRAPGLLRGGQQEVLIAIAAAGFGIFSDPPVGIIGAFIGSWLLHRLGITSAWVVRAIVNATIGAILLLLVARRLGSSAAAGERGGVDVRRLPIPALTGSAVLWASRQAVTLLIPHIF
jgi:uncharacterized membrane protein YeaQ/YmgE (transglycosylase-associated protein family)